MAFHTPRGLSRTAELRHSQFLAILNHVEGNYRVFRIPKRQAGEFRAISSPKPGLRAIQEAITREVASRAVVSDHAHAYLPKRSILTHVAPHVGSSHFVKIDLESFFPSISLAMVRRIFERLGFDLGMSEILARLCTLQEALPQGAPTSPALSNLALIELDAALSAFAETHDLKYTRYADDMVVSGSQITLGLYSLAMDLVKSFGYKINDSKTALIRRPAKIVITGISITTGKMLVPKQYKRELRQRAYGLAFHGKMAFVRDGVFDPFAFDRVMGQLLYWTHVEPEANFPRRYFRILKEMYPTFTR